MLLNSEIVELFVLKYTLQICTGDIYNGTLIRNEYFSSCERVKK